MANEEKNQDDKLFELQEKYLETRSQAAWEEFFILSLQVCKNIVASELLKNKKCFTQEQIDDNALNACIYVLRRYKRIGYRRSRTAPKNYRVNVNFITTLKYGVRHALYYSNMEKRNFDNALSLESLFNSSYKKINQVL